MKVVKCIVLMIVPMVGLAHIIGDNWDFLTQKSFEAPVFSMRCKDLLYDRNNKKAVKQKFNSLLFKTLSLKRETPEAKKSVKRKLWMSEVLLRQKIYAARERIRLMEEDLIKKGCPYIQRASGRPVSENVLQ